MQPSDDIVPASLPLVRVAEVEVDPMLALASAPFTTWTGAVRVELAGDALVLRWSGDEERFVTDLPLATAIPQAFSVVGVEAVAASGVWLPLVRMVPVLGHLTPSDAFDVCSRMRPPIVERVGAAEGDAAFIVRAGLVGNGAGWCAALPA